jgi:hypothetical protein
MPLALPPLPETQGEEVLFEDFLCESLNKAETQIAALQNRN